MVVAALCAGAAGGGGSLGAEPSVPAAKVLTSGERQSAGFRLEGGALVPAMNRFGLSLAQKMEAHYGAGRNLFISPISLDYTLLMLTNGASGATQTAFRRTLGIENAPLASLNGEADLLRSYLAFPARTGSGAAPAEWRMANGIWVNSAGLLRAHGSVPAAFVRTCAANFGATARAVDFAGDGADIINKTVSEATHGKIPHIVQKPIVGDLALTNAVYFKAGWQNTFDAHYTKPAPFTTGTGTKVSLPMMVQTERFGYRKGTGFAAARLPFQTEGATCAMYVFLPNKSGDYSEIWAALAESAAVRRRAFASQKLDLMLPRFKIETNEPGMLDYLKAQGMSGSGDLSAMGLPIAAITKAIHKTYLKVDETGAEAAAATAIVMLTGSAAPRPETPIPFHVNRPFVCAIVEEDTGAILFAGVVNDPAGK